MHSLEPPERPSRRVVWVMLVGAILVAGAASWFLRERGTTTSPAPAATTSSTPGSADRDTPTTANAPASPTERRTPDVPRPRPTPDAKTAAPDATAAPPVAPPAARELRVTTDVAGAYVFLDRKFLGSTPLTTRDVTPGQHQLNVQVEGRPPQVRTIEVLADGPTVVEVTLGAAATALSASVAVVHQHAMGSCEGTLRATGDTLRYDTPHKDAFSVPLAALEQFSVAYAEKRLRVKQRGGRTWNFTTKAETADPLFVFHRDVEAARGR